MRNHANIVLIYTILKINRHKCRTEAISQKMKRINGSG